jgi:hypothetical protein
MHGAKVKKVGLISCEMILHKRITVTAALAMAIAQRSSAVL